MAVVIVNISGHYGYGEQEYELRINHKHIAYFTHVYEEGLGECLRKAAEAADHQVQVDLQQEEANGN